MLRFPFAFHFRCFVENCDENTTISSGLYQAVPLHEKKAVAQCYRFNITTAHNKSCHFNKSNHDAFPEKCNRWVYDTSVFHSTLVTDVSLLTNEYLDIDFEWH